MRSQSVGNSFTSNDEKQRSASLTQAYVHPHREQVASSSNQPVKRKSAPINEKPNVVQTQQSENKKLEAIASAEEAKRFLRTKVSRIQQIDTEMERLKRMRDDELLQKTKIKEEIKAELSKTFQTSDGTKKRSISIAYEDEDIGVNTGKKKNKVSDNDQQKLNNSSQRMTPSDPASSVPQQKVIKKTPRIGLRSKSQLRAPNVQDTYQAIGKILGEDILEKVKQDVEELREKRKREGVQEKSLWIRKVGPARKPKRSNRTVTTTNESTSKRQHVRFMPKE